MAGLARPDPKPARRIKDRSVTKRVCLRYPWCPCGEPVGSGHHVLPKGAPYFGDDVPENIVPMCGSGTTGCHGKIEAADRETRRMLGRWLADERPDVIRYVLFKLGDVPGQDWLRRHLLLRVEV